MLQDCKANLENDDLFDQLRKADFDIVVLDNFALCNILIAQKLSLPFIVSTNKPYQQTDAYPLVMPTPLSYVPATFSELRDKMTFTERLKNVVTYIVGFYMINSDLLKPYKELKQEYDIQPELGMLESIGRAELIMFAIDWTLEFPRPLMPNTVFTGGLLTEKAFPLTAVSCLLCFKFEKCKKTIRHGR